MVLQSRGCVDGDLDSAEHKADLSPFTLLEPPPKPGNTGRKQGHPDESVCQHAEGIESEFRVRGTKKSWEVEGKSAKQGAGRVLTFMWDTERSVL